jgi:putative endonuclease
MPIGPNVSEHPLGGGSSSCMRFYVYVLGSHAKGRTLTYVGWTNDVTRRLEKHNAGKGARTTRGRVWVLLHSETFATKSQAMSREWHLKRERAFRKSLAQGMLADR